jgi:hypothetical protein
MKHNGQVILQRASAPPPEIHLTAAECRSIDAAAVRWGVAFTFDPAIRSLVRFKKGGPSSSGRRSARPTKQP